MQDTCHRLTHPPDAIEQKPLTSRPQLALLLARMPERVAEEQLRVAQDSELNRLSGLYAADFGFVLFSSEFSGEMPLQQDGAAGGPVSIAGRWMTGKKSTTADRREEPEVAFLGRKATLGRGLLASTELQSVHSGLAAAANSQTATAILHLKRLFCLF